MSRCDRGKIYICSFLPSEKVCSCFQFTAAKTHTQLKNKNKRRGLINTSAGFNIFTQVPISRLREKGFSAVFVVVSPGRCQLWSQLHKTANRVFLKTRKPQSTQTEAWLIPEPSVAGSFQVLQGLGRKFGYSAQPGWAQPHKRVGPRPWNLLFELWAMRSSTGKLYSKVGTVFVKRFLSVPFLFELLLLSSAQQEKKKKIIICKH